MDVMDEVEVTVLKVYKVYTYTIPSFCAISLQLRHVQVMSESVNDGDPGVVYYDAFFSEEDHALSTASTLPKQARITKGCAINWGDEFQYGLSKFSCDELSRHCLALLPHHEVFVAYKWEWSSHEAGACSPGDYNVVPSASSEEGQDKDSDSDTGQDHGTSKTHTVTFKCMGANRDSSHQSVLEAVLETRGEGKDVSVRVYPEPENPKDSEAIAFQCFLSGTWKRIGYVVNEALPEVHEALKNNSIISVEFAWVKFLLCWSYSGPGFYAGINICKKGDWSNMIVRCSSTIKK